MIHSNVVFLESVIFMSRCQKCQKLKNRIKSERSNIFEIGHMRKVAQICATCANNFKKSVIFLLPFTFTVHGKNLGKLFQNKGMGM